MPFNERLLPRILDTSPNLEVDTVSTTRWSQNWELSLVQFSWLLPFYRRLKVSLIVFKSHGLLEFDLFLTIELFSETIFHKGKAFGSVAVIFSSNSFCHYCCFLCFLLSCLVAIPFHFLLSWRTACNGTRLHGVQGCVPSFWVSETFSEHRSGMTNSWFTSTLVTHYCPN